MANRLCMELPRTTGSAAIKHAARLSMRRLACSGGDRDRFAHDARACRSCPLP
ncbi:hypothetical protein AB8810_21250 [Xanthomonas sp. NCPPB 3005]|uniref:hypothetical protein n=1 Tax=Xanthomonas sp. NCPPB 3005 TaxID=3240913 RepID=UPI0015C914DD